MDYDGGFHEEEKDGKLFLVYHHPKYRPIPQIKSPSTSAEVANQDLPPLPLFLCPSARRRKDISRDSGLANSSPELVLSTTLVNKFTDHPILPLFWCNNKKFNIECGICSNSNSGTDYYFCDYCYKIYHKECVESPFKIKHPYYPDPHSSLKLYAHKHYTNCVHCGGGGRYGLIYHCTVYQIFMHTVCAMKTIPFVIDQQKVHDHPLTFFPRQDSLLCNICGWRFEKYPTYVCLRCNFVAHKDCMNSPHTIKISRHHHRISRVSSLPYGKWSCGVCRQNIDGDYGAYTCNKCGSYATHSRCALGKYVWDGEELEGVPEKDDITQDAPPFCKTSEEAIHYFLHDHHHLRPEKYILYDENKLCEACVMPIFEDELYSCTECDFILHETCLKSRRRVQHPLHPHPLTLKDISNDDSGTFLWCYACWRRLGGFVYECPKEECDFKLDVRCASISEPFDYQGHDHPLFMSLDQRKQVLCKVCKNRCQQPLNCIKCDFIVCFKCATLPYKARYKNDKHFLTLSWGEERCEGYWCEECEDIVKTLFYWCNDCCTFLHIECLFSQDPYIRPGQFLIIGGNKYQILAKSNTSRPICYHCRNHCQGKRFTRNNRTSCSIDCAAYS